MNDYTWMDALKWFANECFIAFAAFLLAIIFLAVCVICVFIFDPLRAVCITAVIVVAIGIAKFAQFILNKYY
jgi:hypothetical protein